MANNLLEHYKKVVEENNRQIRKETINECVAAVDEFYLELVEKLSENSTMDEVNQFVLFPHKELCKRLNLMI